MNNVSHTLTNKIKKHEMNYGWKWNRLSTSHYQPKKNPQKRLALALLSVPFRFNNYGEWITRIFIEVLTDEISIGEKQF